MVITTYRRVSSGMGPSAPPGEMRPRLPPTPRAPQPPWQSRPPLRDVGASDHGVTVPRFGARPDQTVTVPRLRRSTITHPAKTAEPTIARTAFGQTASTVPPRAVSSVNSALL